MRRWIWSWPQLGTQMEHQWTSMQNIADQLTLTKAVHQAADADSPLELAPLITNLSSFCFGQSLYSGYRPGAG